MLSVSFAIAIVAATSANAATLNVDNKASTNSAASTLAGNLMSYYNEADNGVLPSPYNWWESGGMWASMIQYWHYTGDSTYNDAISSAISSQAGSGQDFMQPSTTGNDDQLWWGIASMTAAEYNLPAPSSGSSWLVLAQNVFNEVSARWDTSSCNGGLHWQISPSASGYGYKNAIANGLLFQLAARLARYTGDDSYTTRANNVYDWVSNVKLIDPSTYAVYDGTDDTEGCSSLDHDEWSYNVGVYLYGVAVMLNHTGDSTTWSPRLDGFIAAAAKGFTNNTGALQETMCEPDGTCNTDQLSFKAYLSRWLAQTAALVPSTATQIQPLLSASVDGALASCNASPSQATCGVQWTTNAFDGIAGVGQQMAALEVVQGTLAAGKALPSAAATSSKRMARTFKA